MSEYIQLDFWEMMIEGLKPILASVPAENERYMAASCELRKGRSLEEKFAIVVFGHIHEIRPLLDSEIVIGGEYLGELDLLSLAAEIGWDHELYIPRQYHQLGVGGRVITI